MRNKLAPVKNVMLVRSAFGELNGRYVNLPGMGALTGESGLGKSFTIANIAVQMNAVFVRAISIWTPYAMMRAIAHELSIDHTSRRLETLVTECTAALIRQQRPVIVDEANHFDTKPVMLHLLRDIHDITQQPVILVSEERLSVKLIKYPQIMRRITAWVEFKPLDLEDLQTLARTICEVTLDEALLVHILEISRGNMRDCTAALSRVERFALAKDLKHMTRELIGKERLVFGAR